ncbi:MAG: type IV pilus modification PilV family protein [Desulfobacteria bacterium]
MALKDNKGFTLIEILIAICILGFGLLATAQMQAVAIKGNSFANKTTTASTLAQYKMEELRGSASPVSGADTKEGYIRTWTVDDKTPATGLRTLTISITWNNCASPQVITAITRM